MSHTTLIIARHGNTFEKGQTPTRVGARTDLPLTIKGHEQGAAIGRWLATQSLLPDCVYASKLQRTRQTAIEILKAAKLTREITEVDFLNEIDYGPDENKTEDEVIARVGAQALQDWDTHAIPPQGWQVNPDDIRHSWSAFGKNLAQNKPNQIILVVTSNGTARFAPVLTGDEPNFSQNYDLKLATGAFGIFKKAENKPFWQVVSWNVKP